MSNELKISPSGKQVAYILKAPNATTNHNNYELWVRGLKDDGARSNGRLILRAGEEAAGLTWLGDDRRIALLTREGRNSKIVLVDVGTGAQEVIATNSELIEPWGFSVSASGNAIAYITHISKVDSAGEDNKARTMAAYGFAIPFGYPWNTITRESSILGRSNITVLRRTSVGKWKGEKISSHIESGRDRGTKEQGFDNVMYPALSPDGKHLAFIHTLDRAAVPARWKENRYVGYIRDATGYTPMVLALYDLNAREIRLAFESPWVRQSPIRWSDDSRALAVRGVPPIGSVWEKKYSTESLELLAGHVFTIGVSNSIVSEVLGSSIADKDQEAIGGIASWKHAEDEILMQRDAHTFARMRLSGEEWRESDRFIVPGVEMQGDYLIAGSGEYLVGVRQDSGTPPDLFAYELATKKSWILTDLNPSMREAALGSISEVEWTNRFKSKAHGYLIKPIGYEPGKRYPLVILAYMWNGNFICDSQNNIRTSMPPQPLANAGFLVLEADWPQREVAQGYEDGAILWEFENWVATIESAVNVLVTQGLADGNNVGLIGWSRSSSKTDFLLTHSSLKLAAASSADSGGFNYGAYWFAQQPAEQEAFYGGPPYGSAFQDWLKYAPPFNADKVTAPLLMEYMGYGFGGMFTQPIYAYEFFTALHRQGKPVELYFYPNGEHELDTPFERVASLQRNVDWFRFWMQGYEGKAPDYDPDQYVRWRKLREQQQWNDRMHAQGKDPAAEFLRQTRPGAILEDAEVAPAAYEKPN